MTDYRIESATKEEWAERALRAEAALQWQPIETAPKDGTEIIVLCKRGVVFSGRWSCLPEEFAKNAFTDSDAGRWRSCTHWMPKPPPPKTSPGSDE